MNLEESGQANLVRRRKNMKICVAYIFHEYNTAKKSSIFIRNWQDEVRQMKTGLFYNTQSKIVLYCSSFALISFPTISISYFGAVNVHTCKQVLVSLLTLRMRVILHFGNSRHDLLAWCFHCRKPERVVGSPIISCR